MSLDGSEDPFGPTDWTMDSPSRFLSESRREGDHSATTDSSWTPSVVAAGLTPSLLASSVFKSGLTPSVLGDGLHSLDYFAIAPSHSGGDARSTRASYFDDSSFGCEDAGEHDWNSFGSSDRGGFRRKRAMSSPAIHTPTEGNTPFPRYESSASFLVQRQVKRPRLDVGSESSTTNESQAAPSATEDTNSPGSSTVLTPPDGDPSATVRVAYVAKTTTIVDPLAFDLTSIDYGVRGSVSSDVFAYEQFLVPNTFDPVPYQPFRYELEIKERPSTGCASVNGSDEVRTNSAAKGSTKKARKSGSKDGDLRTFIDAASPARSGTSDDEGLDEETRRRLFLERNRLAAIKSRQKKKANVMSLESLASDLCQRNNSIQTIAISLREEMLALRRQLDRHEGCACEHARGYKARERAGGGIPTIEGLAGRTLYVDYTRAPTMGSEDDVYGSFASQTGHGEPVTRIPSIPASSTKASSRRPRPSGGGAPAHAKPGSDPAASCDAKAKQTGVKPEQSIAASAVSAGMGAAIPIRSRGEGQEAEIAPSKSLPLRASSAPPTTPTFVDKTSYFA